LLPLIPVILGLLGIGVPTIAYFLIPSAKFFIDFWFALLMNVLLIVLWFFVEYWVFRLYFEVIKRGIVLFGGAKNLFLRIQKASEDLLQ
jgi:hypothetical protein